jgi:hypothetical protein
MALSEQQERDFKEGGWQFGCTLTTENVWDVFVILTLLDYHDRCGTRLQVPHDGEQKTRFEAAMRARNLEVIKEGQDEIAHCCDKCMRVYKGPDGTARMFPFTLIFASLTNHLPGNIQLVIGDGLSMGCRRCQVSHCTTELASNRHRFCPVHKDLDDVCSIVGCNTCIVPGKKSCTDPAHQKVEELHFQRGKAAFTLHERLQKHRQLHPHDQATALEEDEANKGLDDEGQEWFVEDGDGNVAVHRQIHPGSIGVDDSALCEAVKSDTGNRKYKALFGGVRTHNEQILVRPCGVICSRATFYNAEAVSNVLVRLSSSSSTSNIN